MTMTEIRTTAKNTAAQTFIDQNPDCAAVVDADYTYVVPVVVGGETYYVKWSAVVCQWNDTKSRPAFNFNTDTVDAQQALDILMEEQANASEKKNSKKKVKEDK